VEVLVNDSYTSSYPICGGVYSGAARDRDLGG
jgi:hypothetical protein